MAKKKIEEKEIKESILKIIDNTGWTRLSIREVTIRLKEEYSINLSPQVVKRYLFKLKKEGKID